MIGGLFHQDRDICIVEGVAGCESMDGIVSPGVYLRVLRAGAQKTRGELGVPRTMAVLLRSAKSESAYVRKLEREGKPQTKPSDTLQTKEEVVFVIFRVESIGSPGRMMEADEHVGKDCWKHRDVLGLLGDGWF